MLDYKWRWIPLWLDRYQVCDYSFMKAVEGWNTDAAATARYFHSEGDIFGNNWKEAPNGEGYISWLRTAGFADILARVSDLLSPQIQSLFERYADYGYGEAGRVPGLDRGVYKTYRQGQEPNEIDFLLGFF